MNHPLCVIARDDAVDAIYAIGPQHPQPLADLHDLLLQKRQANDRQILMRFFAGSVINAQN
eukprot:917290-Pelagomonas_calceolata.AAC.2